MTIHGAQVQACRAPARAGTAWRIRVRLVNASGHAHTAGASVPRGGTSGDQITFSATPGQTTPVKSLVLPRNTSDRVSIGLGELSGEGLGDSLGVTQVDRC